MNHGLDTRWRLILDRFPKLYLSLLRFKRRSHWSKSWIVAKDTEVVIEGFPRSANSFACEAFISGQRQTRHGTHVHSSAQVVQACKWNIPTLVLLRHPHGAVCGDIAFGCELDERDPLTVSAEDLNDSLRRYTAFYERVEPYRRGFVVGHFPDVVKDFGAVMRHFNEYFGTDFKVFEHTKESADAIKSLAFHVGPQPNRETIKLVVQQKYQDEASGVLKSRAEAVYRRLLATEPS